MVSTDATAMPTEHRLHISGLTPQISPADLKERFQRYGNVHSVDTVGPDALGKHIRIDPSPMAYVLVCYPFAGQPRNFVYLTIDAKQQDLTKCGLLGEGILFQGSQTDPIGR